MKQKYVFLEFSCFFYDPTDVDDLISGFPDFSKSSLNAWKFSVYALLKPNLENFEYYFTSMWNECIFAIIWAFFGIVFLWNWNENWPFPALWPLLYSKFAGILSAALSQHHLLGFWNSSTGIPSPPLALFVVMIPKAQLILHSRISGSRWVSTTSWLSGYEDLFCIVILCIVATSS